MSTPIPDSERIPLKEKIAYGAGNVAVGVQEQADKALLNPVFVLQVGIAPSTMSLLGLVYRLWDAVTDAVMGWVSDNTRTRWGRRKPYLVVGAVLMGVWMPMLFMFDASWGVGCVTVWMACCMLVLYLTNTIYNIPYQCLLLEMTPNSVERTNVAVWRAYLGKTVELVMVWMWKIVQLPIFTRGAGTNDIVYGARWVTGGLGILVMVLGLLPALFVRERYYQRAVQQAKHSLWQNFRMTFANRPFVLLVVLVLLYAIGLNMKWGLDFYTKLYYVCGGNRALAATLQGIQGTLTTCAGLAGVPLFQWVARRFGKLRALQVTMYIVFCASVLTWVAYTPAYPYLSLTPGLLLSPAVSGIWVIVPSLTGDIVDYDELRTGERREGAFAAIFSWSFKFALSLSAALSGPLVELAGFRSEWRDAMPMHVVHNMRVLLALTPVFLIGPAIWLSHRFPLTTEVIEEIRGKLEAKRGRI